MCWPVSMTVRFHLFPFRTQKLSSLVPKIVGWKRPVKIGRCRLLFLLWPVGQAVKTAASHAVNVGSIPARVTKKHYFFGSGAFFFILRFSKRFGWYGDPCGNRKARAPRPRTAGQKQSCRLAVHNEHRQSAKPTRSCGYSSYYDEYCSLPVFASSTVAPRSQPHSCF